MGATPATFARPRARQCHYQCGSIGVRNLFMGSVVCQYVDLLRDNVSYPPLRWCLSTARREGRQVTTLVHRMRRLGR
jgi:hypothetical protein